MSMGKHDHTECAHDIKHCFKCDVVFCVACSKEWRQVPTYTSGTFLRGITVQPTDITTITGGGNVWATDGAMNAISVIDDAEQEND
jgi:hypothetical protein